MKVLITLIFIFWVCSNTFSLKAKEESQACLSLTLKNVFERIENENLTILLNREKIEEALYSAYTKRAELFPQMNLNFTQGRTRIIANFGGPAAAFHSTRYNGDLEGSLSLIDLPKWAAYNSAKLGHAIQEQTYKAIQEDILNEAGRYYLEHLRNLKRLEVLQANIELSETLLNIAHTRFTSGVSSSLDLTRAKVQLSKDKKALLEHQIRLSRSELNLKRILDIAPCTPIQLAPLEESQRLAPSSYTSCLSDTLNMRPDYLAALKQYKQNCYEKKAARFEYYPKVNTTAKWGYTSARPLDGGDAQEWALGINVSMPLFDGMRIKNNTLRLASKARAQNLYLLELEGRIQAELAINQTEMQSRFKQIQLAQEQVQLGKQELELAKTKFIEGTADNSALIDAQANLKQFSDELIESVYFYDLSRLEWARANGNVFNFAIYAH